MKTKIGIALISLLFMMACGIGEQPKDAEQAEKQPESNKMILKAYNNMYVSIIGDTILAANQTDPSLAEVFEKVDQGNGKWALKTSSGKFVSANHDYYEFLVANRKEVKEWEQFEIIPVDESGINLKSYMGKVVSADRNIGDRLVANRDQAGDWEMFTVEYK